MLGKGFRWENDIWWWEKVRLDEFGLPDSYNFIIPDKLMHFLAVFLLSWLLSRCLGRNLGVLFAWLIMMVPWEIIWDGCFRNGASWKDMIANTLGGLVCWWWLGNPTVGQAQP